MHYYVLENGRTIGPLSSSQLRDMAVQGRISTSALVSNEAGGPWVSVHKVKGLKVSAPAPPQRPLSPAVVIGPSAASASSAAIHSAPPQEKLLWSGRPSQIVNLGTFILCGLFFWLIIPIFVALWHWLTVRSSTCDLTSQRYRITHGVLSRRTDDLELYRVKDTAFVQPFFLRLFSLANVVMTTSDITTPVMSIEAIPAEEARQLRETIRTHVEHLRDRKRVRELDVI